MDTGSGRYLISVRQDGLILRASFGIGMEVSARGLSNILQLSGFSATYRLAAIQASPRSVPLF